MAIEQIGRVPCYAKKHFQERENNKQPLEILLDSI